MAIFHVGPNTYLKERVEKNLKAAKWISYAIALILGVATAQLIDYYVRDLALPLKLLTLGIFFAIYATIIRIFFLGYRKYIIESRKYHVGSIGEDITAEELHKLPDSFVVFQDLKPSKTRHANIDFVVSGPNGLFLLEVKNHHGIVQNAGSILKLNGRIFEKDIVQQTLYETKTLSEYIRTTTRIQPDIIPIIVFSNEQVRIAAGGSNITNGVQIVKLRQLNQFLQTFPKRTLQNNNQIEQTLIFITKREKD